MNTQAKSEGMQDNHITASKVMISGLSCFHVRSVNKLFFPEIRSQEMPASVSQRATDAVRRSSLFAL
jgi:hypothetical protein